MVLWTEMYTSVSIYLIGMRCILIDLYFPSVVSLLFFLVNHYILMIYSLCDLQSLAGSYSYWHQSK